MVVGDLRGQPEGKNPFPVIVALKELLTAHGVDFLFVPVPTKAAVYADKLQSGGPHLVGRVVTPYERKLLLELGQAGVEVIDLLPAFLADRTRGDRAGEPLYLAQDTHWTDRGLRLAAKLIADRIREYPWHAELDRSRTTYTLNRSAFKEEGDLPSRLGADERRRYQAVEMVGHQVVRADGSLYEDDAGSPITVMGDSFVGVFERTFCRHAGLSAHLAYELGSPVDLVMSYGGGPNVRRKLFKRGAAALAQKRLVIWVMAARDLYNYWEDWELLEVD
jgi:alginate O-acetyltransferase complex protein AlgJ